LAASHYVSADEAEDIRPLPEPVLNGANTTDEAFNPRGVFG
jgi:hypothetical protein